MEEDFVKHVEHLVIQLAIILAAAKVGGEICERYLKIPTVLGELAMGTVIGPFALGGVAIFGLGPLFSLREGHDALPVSLELFSVSQIAAVVLLFTAGLETDLKQFRRYAAPASLVALGGVLAPFALGAGATMLLKPAGLEGDTLLYAALFMGAVMTATSVGITARVLGDMHKLDSPEGVTIMAAAVVDDVLGILVLTVVVGIATPGEELSTSGIALIGAKAVGFWLTLMIGGILASKYISRAFESLRVSGASVALAMALALLASGLAESFGLAMIIGAYSIGLALSDTHLKEKIERPILAGLYPALVPVFFVVMGMLVDVSAMGGTIVFSLIITLLAIISKVVGSGLPALAVGFTKAGSMRVGIGMLPRGEVALIIAGVGLSRGVIGSEMFGVSILMTVITTFMAAVLLTPAFRKGGPGRRGSSE